MTPDEKRTAIVTSAAAAAGLQGVGATREAYLDLIAKGEGQRMRDSMLTMSGCALVVAGIWREAGVVDGALAAPYKIGTAVSRLVQIAKRAGAWREPSPILPQRGDMVLVGQNAPAAPRAARTKVQPVDSSDRALVTAWEKTCALVLKEWGGSEHVFTVVDVDLSGGTVTSVDGGQMVPGGGPWAVKYVTRHFSTRGSGAGTQLWFGGRRMVGSVDVSALVFAQDEEIEVTLDNA